MPAHTPKKSVDSIRIWAMSTWATGCSARGARCSASRFRRSAAEIASPPPRSQEGPKRRRRRHTRRAAPLCSASVAMNEIHHNAPELPACAGWRHLHEGPVLLTHNEALVPQMQRGRVHRRVPHPTLNPGLILGEIISSECARLLGARLQLDLPAIAPIDVHDVLAGPI